MRKLFFIFCSLILCFVYASAHQVYATVSVVPATGGSAISADTTNGTYTTLTGPTLKEGANRDIPASGTIVLQAPSGFIFNTGANVTATISRISGSNSCFAFTATTATSTNTTITFTLKARDGSSTKCQVIFSNIQVSPSSGTPLASGSITDTGTALIKGMTSATDLGALTEVAGAKNKLIITQQPSATAIVGTNFITSPIIQLEDQFGNIETGDNSSTITITAVLSTQFCGGTNGSGILSSTPTSGSAIKNGVMTYSAMQYSAAEDIKICFSSPGVTSALSNAIIVGIVSVSITSNGVISYGFVPLNTSKNTTASGLTNTQTVQNNSTLPEDFTISGQNTSCPWILASINGANQYVHSFSLDGGNIWTPLTTSLQSFVTNIASGGTQNFDLQITMPTSTNCYAQQSVDVVIQATAH